LFVKANRHLFVQWSTIRISIFIGYILTTDRSKKRMREESASVLAGLRIWLSKRWIGGHGELLIMHYGLLIGLRLCTPGEGD
jgi:hemin uptake protein HemP